jgi:hypothetical protein
VKQALTQGEMEGVWQLAIAQLVRDNAFKDITPLEMARALGDAINLTINVHQLLKTPLKVERVERDGRRTGLFFTLSYDDGKYFVEIGDAVEESKKKS